MDRIAIDPAGIFVGAAEAGISQANANLRCVDDVVIDLVAAGGEDVDSVGVISPAAVERAVIGMDAIVVNQRTGGGHH